MNVEIVRELARIWRKRGTPEPMQYREVPKEMSEPPDLLQQKLDQAQEETFNQCAQDLEDVIRIYHEFKHNQETA